MLLVVLISLAYVALLFFIAYAGDSAHFRTIYPQIKKYIYAFSIAVYCSSWTFYGAVGTTVVSGWDYVTIYLGPLLFFVFGYSVVRQIIIICKQNNLTSISDFVASRFNKSRTIGVLVTLIAVMGSLPYIALQLKAVSDSFLTLSVHFSDISETSIYYWHAQADFLLVVMLILFSILFGTRHLDATEHHQGMVMAISFESIVKITMIVMVGVYALWWLLQQYDASSISDNLLTQLPAFNPSSFLIKLLLSFSAILLLPRQFQVMIVESENSQQFLTARWVMPLYLLLTSIVILPIALAGLALLPEQNPDLYVLSVSLTTKNEWMAILAFVGGFSAATGMVIVASVSLSIMVCNDIVIP